MINKGVCLGSQSTSPVEVEDIPEHPDLLLACYWFPRTKQFDVALQESESLGAKQRLRKQRAKIAGESATAERWPTVEG